MRNWFLLLISVAALAQAAPPARVEIDYEVTRNGMALADIEHRFEHTGGAYQVTETWRGRGLFYLRSEEHTSELQSPCNLVCRLLLEKKKNIHYKYSRHTLQILVRTALCDR